MRLNPPQRNQSSTLKNPTQYYTLFIDSLISYLIFCIPYHQIPSFFLTISNEKNLDLNKQQRTKYESRMTSALFFGSILGTLLTSYLTKFNTKYLLNSIKLLLFLVHLSGIFCENMNILVFLRFLMGILGDILAVTIKWASYEICLPEHKVNFLNFLYLVSSFAHLFHYFTAFFDDGGRSYWKIVFLLPCFLALLSLLIHLIIIKRINTITFLNFEGGEIFLRRICLILR